jgi:heme O synthase-like polyprenyltransferase
MEALVSATLAAALLLIAAVATNQLVSKAIPARMTRRRRRS